MAAMADTSHRLRSYTHMIGMIPDAMADVPEQIVDVLRADIERKIDAGVDPDGKPWELRKDGKKALQTAKKSLYVAAVGRNVYARLAGHAGMHHFGYGRGRIERKVLPGERLPSDLSTEMAKTISRALSKHTRKANG